MLTTCAVRSPLAMLSWYCWLGPIAHQQQINSCLHNSIYPSFHNNTPDTVTAAAAGGTQARVAPSLAEKSSRAARYECKSGAASQQLRSAG
jgi:hypothetical protein